MPTLLARPLNRSAAALAAALLAYVVAPMPWAALAYFVGGFDSALRIYLVSAVLGFPAYWYLLRRGWVRLWQFSSSGFCLGALSGVAFATWYCIKEGVFGSEAPNSLMLVVTQVLIWNVIHGLFIAVTAWFVVRVIASDPTYSNRADRLRQPLMSHVKRDRSA